MPVSAAVRAAIKTAAAAMSLTAAMDGCCWGSTWSHRRSMAVLRASATHTKPITMTMAAHSMVVSPSPCHSYEYCGREVYVRVVFAPKKFKAATGIDEAV